MIRSDLEEDILIRGARIVDGSGAPWRRGDLRVSGGRIARVGRGLAPDGARVVEAGDRFLAPGFIDAHCHDDLANLRHPSREERILQGVTTVVVGTEHVFVGGRCVVAEGRSTGCLPGRVLPLQGM